MNFCNSLVRRFAVSTVANLRSQTRKHADLDLNMCLPKTMSDVQQAGGGKRSVVFGKRPRFCCYSYRVYLVNMTRNRPSEPEVLSEIM
jgi:hypothetical protein